MEILVLKCSGDSKSWSEKSDIYAILNLVELDLDIVEILILKWIEGNSNESRNLSRKLTREEIKVDAEIKDKMETKTI